MIASKTAHDLIKTFEGFSPNAYTCPAGHATIGYGHKLHDGPVNEDDKELYWTPKHAEIVLMRDTAIAEQALNRAIRVPVNQNQFDALVSWTYNFGVGRLKESTCTWLRELNAGNYSAVAPQILRWNRATVNGKPVEVPGLTSRRKKEAELFDKPYPND